MTCEQCHGKGQFQLDDGVQPCGACNGTGSVHCCEGLIEQPYHDVGDVRVFDIGGEA